MHRVVTCDQNVLGSPPVWVALVWTVGLKWFIKGLEVWKTGYCGTHLKDPLESVQKSRELSPGARFLSVTD